MISHVVHLDVSIVLRIAPTLWISISLFVHSNYRQVANRNLITPIISIHYQHS